MQISITATLSPALKPDILCRFFENGVAYHLCPPGSAASKRPDLPQHLFAGTAGLELESNLGAMKYTERGDALRTAGAAALKQVRRSGGEQIAWLLDGEKSPAVFAELMEGLLLAEYRYLDYKAKPKVKASEPKLTVVAGAHTPAFKKELARLQAVMKGVALARNLANLPACDLPPAKLAQAASELAKSAGLEFTLLNARQLAAGRYAGLMAVGGGSANPPVLFALRYQPKKAQRGVQPICFVGKGITFDSGGISIKPWEGMWDMKADMSGAAAVLGIMQDVAALELPIPVTGIVAAAENMPSGTAYRPGDILRYRNGKSVEIHSTDAEGRLVLADALIYAQETAKQRRIVEFSTLTGACVRALGHQYIGLLSRSAELASSVMQAAAASGELCWELPLHPEYRKMIDSQIADFRNSGGPLAGASTAGMFLHEFIEDGTEYVHLDIAGVFLAEQEEKYWGQPGATGAGVRLAVKLCEQLCAR